MLIFQGVSIASSYMSFYNLHMVWSTYPPQPIVQVNGIKTKNMAMASDLGR